MVAMADDIAKSQIRPNTAVMSDYKGVSCIWEFFHFNIVKALFIDNFGINWMQKLITGLKRVTTIHFFGAMLRNIQILVREFFSVINILFGSKISKN